jgi:RND family efflux transporter MFP subunit
MLLATVFLVSCKSGSENSDKETVKNVKTIHPVRVENTVTKTLPGVVKVSEEIKLAFKTAGQISKVHVKEGDYVREGSIIAELDKKDYMLQLEASEIQYNQLKSEVERMEKLHQKNSISGNDFEKAQAGLEALGIQLKANKNTMDYTVLRAPVSGYVQSVNFVKLEMVNAGTPVVTLIDVSSVKVETELPASLFLRQDDFLRYFCRTNLVENKEIPLKFIGINKKSNSSQLYKMNFVPASEKSGLAPGMNVEVMIILNESSEGTSYTLPAKTIFTQNGKTYVWTVENNIAKKKEVQTGSVDNTGRIIILSGISDEDEVIEAGIRVIEENDKVNVIAKPNETNKGGLL